MIQISSLLKEHQKNNYTENPKKLIFSGVDGFDVYNITAPFILGKKRILAGRVEQRENETSTINLFEEQSNGTWKLLDNSISLPLQDPFITEIDHEIIIGGVEVLEGKSDKSWRTNLYRLQSISNAEKFFEGPLGMKDLRLKQLDSGQILVLTRPQGIKGGRGKIGILTIDSLKELSHKKIADAPLLENQFSNEEWGGANEIHVKDNHIYVLSHIANFDSYNYRHYYAMLFEIDLSFKKIIHAKIIAERSDFLEGPFKRPDLKDVVFSGGLQVEDTEMTLYAGISDAEAQTITIKNFFK